MRIKVPWQNVHRQNPHATLRPKHSSPMDRHQAPPISDHCCQGWPGPLMALCFYKALCGLIVTPRLEKSECVDALCVDATSRHQNLTWTGHQWSSMPTTGFAAPLTEIWCTPIWAMPHPLPSYAWPYEAILSLDFESDEPRKQHLCLEEIVF